MSLYSAPTKLSHLSTPRWCVSMASEKDSGVKHTHLGCGGAGNSIQKLPTDFVGSATLTLTGLVSGSDIVILEAGTETAILLVDANAGTTYDHTYGHTGVSPGAFDILVYLPGQIPFAVRSYTLQITNASLPVAQMPDPSYLP
jgi:hypothetical protein